MRAVITVLGKDAVGILAAVSNECSKVNANITDVTQSILQDLFAMIMIVEFKNATVSFIEFSESLEILAKNKDLKIHVMNEEIFETMHKI